MPPWRSCSPASVFPACSESGTIPEKKRNMKRSLSFLLALLLFGGILFPAEASAVQEEPAMQQSSYSAAWIAGAMKILGIKDAGGNPVSEEMLYELAGQIKSLLDVAKNLSDETLAPLIRSAISKYGFTMDESQLNTLLSFFRSSGEEKDKSLSSRIQDLQDTVSKVSETASKAARFFRTVRRSFQEVVNWFSHVKDLFH